MAKSRRYALSFNAATYANLVQLAAEARVNPTRYVARVVNEAYDRWQERMRAEVVDTPREQCELTLSNGRKLAL